MIRHNSRFRQMLGVVTGVQTPTVQVIGHRWPWYWRLAGFVARRTGRVMRRRARILVPVYVGAAVWLTAALAHLIDRGWMTVAWLDTVPVLWTWWAVGGWMWRLTRRRRLPTTVRRLWYAGACIAGVAWSITAARWGAGPPRLGYLLVATLVCWGAWAWRYRTRPVPVAQVGEPQRIWATIKKLNGTTLHNVATLANPPRFEADIDLSETDLLVEDVIKAGPHIGKAFRKPASNVIVDWAPGRVELTAKLTVVEDNPLQKPVIYDETWIPTTADIAAGVVPFHAYPDGRRGKVRLWHERAGCLNVLMSGDLRKGKSAGMEALGIQAMFTGRVWLMVGDPQGGVSMPALCGAQGQAQWQAPCREGDNEPIWRQLCAIEEAMQVREDALSRFEWVDEYVDRQVGLNCWDADITGWPAIGYILDEGWMFMGDPDFAPLIKRILKRQGKLGFFTVLATQYPGIEEFNNDMALRQCFTAGNILSYANSAGSVKAMILPSHLPSPFDIPIETVDGEHTKGTLIAYSQAPHSSLPVYSRSVWPKRAKHWASLAAVNVPDLEPAVKTVFDKYMNPTAAAPAVPVREQVAAPAPAQRKPRETYETRILAYLRDVPNGWAHTGVIAHELGIDRPRVSEALSRAERKDPPLVRQVRTGVWACATSEALDSELVEAAA